MSYTLRALQPPSRRTQVKGSQPRACVSLARRSLRCAAVSSATKKAEAKQHPRAKLETAQKLAFAGGLALVLAVSTSEPSYAERSSRDTRNNVPSSLSSTDSGDRGVVGLGKLLRGEKGREIQDCSRKCLPACLRGGEGAPGLGPMTVRRELVVFKDGFRDRKYCLTECTTVCALSYTGDPSAKK